MLPKNVRLACDRRQSLKPIEKNRGVKLRPHDFNSDSQAFIITKIS